MPGFLARYAEIVRLDLGDPYWIDIRPKLTVAEASEAKARLIRPIYRSATADQGDTEQTEVSSAVDMDAYHRELAAHAIVDWNLTDADDRPLPREPIEALRASIALLPDEVLGRIIAAIQPPQPSGNRAERRAKEKAATARFPR